MQSEANAASGGTEFNLVKWAEKVYIPDTHSARTSPGYVVQAPDGYLRKTPVQEIRAPKGYKKRIVWRVISIILGLVFVAAVIYVILTYLLKL
jgi:hypothetical protein